MDIGSSIKKLRRERDITQEQLAEYLGITSRAISQWETGRTSPDISMIPALCHVFNVSADDLLGIHTEKNAEEIQKCLELACSKANQGNFENSMEILQEALLKYPKSYEIMQSLANNIICVKSRNGIKEYDDAIDLCHRILSECTDNALRYETMEILGTAYEYADQLAEMRKLSEEMPVASISRESFMLYRWNGDADFKKRQGYLKYLIEQLLIGIECLSEHCHDDGKKIYSAEDRIELQKLQVDLLELLFPNKDYQTMAQIGETACRRIAISMIKRKDFNCALEWIQKSANFAIYMDMYVFDSAHTSTILRGFSGEGWIMEADGNHSQSMLEWLSTNEIKEIFSSNSEYKSLCSRLKEKARM